MEWYRRGIETTVAGWEVLARAVDGASVRRLPAVAMAVFPEGPERAVYNNAVPASGLSARDRSKALDVIESEYAAAGVHHFAVWVHEHDAALARDLERRGYRLAEKTRAMGMELDALPAARPVIEVRPSRWADHVALLGMPSGFLVGVEEGSFHVALLEQDGRSVATGVAFDRQGDSGIYNVGTVEQFRRRGLGTAVTAVLLYDARDRGCTTATLQATPIAERIYARLGFDDAGQILEYSPGQRFPGIV
jgi:ribosomal protein S18 acetylase RimI-like enzyme